MGTIDVAGCEDKGLDKKKVGEVVKLLSKGGRMANRMGLCVFGGSGGGTLRTRDHTIVAYLDGEYDGGDGGSTEDENGVMRGEVWWDERKREGRYRYDEMEREQG